MKKISSLVLFLFSVSCVMGFAQETNLKSDSVKISSIHLPKTGLTTIQTSSRYTIYPTNELKNLLKLDTSTGQIWRVQWALDELRESRVEAIVNSQSLLPSNKPGINGRFAMYPTEDPYNYILLDTIDGMAYPLGTYPQQKLD